MFGISKGSLLETISRAGTDSDGGGGGPRGGGFAEGPESKVSYRVYGSNVFLRFFYGYIV